MSQAGGNTPGASAWGSWGLRGLQGGSDGPRGEECPGTQPMHLLSPASCSCYVSCMGARYSGQLSTLSSRPGEVSEPVAESALGRISSSRDHHLLGLESLGAILSTNHFSLTQFWRVSATQRM